MTPWCKASLRQVNTASNSVAEFTFSMIQYITVMLVYEVEIVFHTVINDVKFLNIQAT